ncbi:acyltransferase domain-containing protein [Humibacter sp. RRB41]|uniref:acyltransferase domain-containing protein n=1 Tax=Humibacter sp. RRB41 TaxID=2919946 RepID=UPI001FAB1421|nr:acyltransferase domain-containing protein [Humibacter sp. RRB41]
MIDLSDLALRLEAASDDRALAVLGFRDDDRAEVRLAIEAALHEPERLAEIQTLAERLRSAIGRIESPADSLELPPADSTWRGIGVVPMLALLAVADDVRSFHRSRGISTAVSDCSLSDLGQQAWVHRRTFGAFGLHTYEWMATAFSGNLYWLGRLQFNLVEHDGEWMLSTHIPEIGPLTPESVDDSFRQASAFFAEHFPDYPTRLFYCGSWLLDPQLAAVLKPESNMVRFQKRWTPTGEIGPADEDAVFFVFRRRGEFDRSTLPRETSLQRAILDKLDSGGHWSSWGGTLEKERT